MLKILFVSTSVPFPARHGVELPLQNIIKYLAERHIVDLLVISKGEKYHEEFLIHKQNVPVSVRNVDIISTRPMSKTFAVVRELVGKAPSFLLDRYDVKQLAMLLKKRHYDIVWFSPIGCIGLWYACHLNGLELSDKFVVGLNDPKVTLYWDSFRQLFTGHVPFSWNRVIKGLRLPWIWLYERRYLRDASMIHVQTKLERVRMSRILGKGKHGIKIVDAPNGRKLILDEVRYRGKGSNRVLFMTHLSGGRQHESVWFLKQIWPLVANKVSDAELWLVGTPPKDESRTRCLPRNVRICGYVQNLPELFDSVALSVVPTHHGTGWINRVVDSLVAGVPIVACSEPLATIPGLEVGVHALKGDTAVEFADNMVRLMLDAELREAISANAKSFAAGLPTWESTVGKLEVELVNLDNGLPSLRQAVE